MASFDAPDSAATAAHPAVQPMRSGSGVAPAPVADWRLLYRVGGLAAWATVLLIALAIASHVVSPPPPWAPGAAADWFAYLQEHPFVGLLNLDLAMAIGLVLSVPLYLALYVALHRDDPSLMLLATAVALLGILLHLLSNTALEMRMFSDAYAAATSEAERAVYLGAGEGSLSAYYGMVFQVSYVLGYLAYVLVGLVMRRGSVFSRRVANLGIVTGVAGFGFYLPEVGLAVSVIVVLLIAVWNAMVGTRLFRLGRR